MTQIVNPTAGAQPITPTRNQLLRLYHWQHLATTATRCRDAEWRVYRLLVAAYGPVLGEHLAHKLLRAEEGSVAGWLLTLDTANTRTFWASDELHV